MSFEWWQCQWRFFVVDNCVCKTVLSNSSVWHWSYDVQLRAQQVSVQLRAYSLPVYASTTQFIARSFRVGILHAGTSLTTLLAKQAGKEGGGEWGGGVEARSPRCNDGAALRLKMAREVPKSKKYWDYQRLFPQTFTRCWSAMSHLGTTNLMKSLCYMLVGSWEWVNSSRYGEVWLPKCNDGDALRLNMARDTKFKSF